MRSPRYHILLALLLAPAIALATPPVDERPIEQRFTPEQMRATGLDRLSGDELALLNRLLREERSTAKRAEAVQRAGLKPSRTGNAGDQEITRIDGRLRGEFRGWSPGTVLELENGQRWRVVEGQLSTRRVASPAVTISRGLVGAWYLKVDGQTPRAKVQRVQ